jgi:hypothetical protein
VVPGAGSDHWSVCLEWARLGEFVKRPFRFEKFWLTHPDFKRLILEWWKGFEETKGSQMYTLQQKLKYIKANMKKWKKESFGNIMEEKIRLEEKIGDLQQCVMQDGYSEEETI